MFIVQSFYCWTLNKLQHKHFQLSLVQKNVLYNILKVLRNPLEGEYRKFYFLLWCIIGHYIKVFQTYIDMVDTICKFIQEEHPGNWELHLQAVSEMLPYFADSGHNNCTIQHMHLQQMYHLQDEHLEVTNIFKQVYMQ